MRLDGFVRSFRAGGIDLSDSILFRGGGDGGGDLIWDRLVSPPVLFVVPRWRRALVRFRVLFLGRIWGLID